MVIPELFKTAFVNPIVGLAVSGITGLAGYIWTRKRKNRDLIREMNETIENMSEKYMEMSATVIDLSDRIIRLEQENQQLKSTIFKLKNCQENG